MFHAKRPAQLRSVIFSGCCILAFGAGNSKKTQIWTSNLILDII